MTFFGGDMNHRYVFQQIRNVEVDGKMAPKDIHVLNPGTHEYITLHDKRDSADGITLVSSHRNIILDYLGSPM